MADNNAPKESTRELSLDKNQRLITILSDTISKDISRSRSTFKKVSDRYLAVHKNERTTSTNKRNKEIVASSETIKSILPIFDTLYDSLFSIAQDTSPDTCDNNIEELAVIVKLMKGGTFKNVLAQLDDEIKSIKTSYKTGHDKGTSSNPTTGYKVAKDIRDEMQQQFTIIESFIRKVESFIEKKRKLKKSWAKNIKDKIKSALDLDVPKKKREYGKLVLGGLGLAAGAFLKSEGFAIAGGAMLAKRKANIEKVKELHKKKINNIYKIRNDIEKVVSEHRSNSRFIAGKQDMSNSGFMAGGGSIVAKKSANVLLGERKIGDKFGAENFKLKSGDNISTGRVTSPTQLKMGAGDELNVDPEHKGGVSKIDSSAFKSKTKLGGGTGNPDEPESEKISNVGSITTPIVAAIRSNTFVLTSIADRLDTANDYAADIANKDKGATPTKVGSGLSAILDPKKPEESGGGGFLPTMLGSMLGPMMPALMTALVPLILPVLTGAAMIGAVVSLWKSSKDMGKDLEDLKFKKGDNAVDTHDNVYQAAKNKGYTDDKAQGLANRERMYGKDSEQQSLWDMWKNGDNRNKPETDNPKFIGQYAKGGAFSVSEPSLMEVGEDGEEDVYVIPKDKQANPMLQAPASATNNPFMAGLNSILSPSAPSAPSAPSGGSSYSGGSYPSGGAGSTPRPSGGGLKPSIVSPSGGGGGSVAGNVNAGTGAGIKKAGGVDLSKVNPKFESNFEGMAAEYKALTGNDIHVNSGYRDTAKQERLYAENLAQYPPFGNGKVAKPGRSPHEKGLAIDINSADANKADSLGLLSKWGISRPLLNNPRIPEAWHLQPAGVATASYPTLASSGGVQAKIGGGGGSGSGDATKEQQGYADPSGVSGAIGSSSGGSSDSVASAMSSVPNLASQAESSISDVATALATDAPQSVPATGSSSPTVVSPLGNVPIPRTPDKVQMAQAEVNMTSEVERQKIREREQTQAIVNSSIIKSAANSTGGSTVINSGSSAPSNPTNTVITTGDNSMISMYTLLLGRV